MLVMENSEEVLQILERFTKLKQKDIPKELEDYLSYVAKTGDTVYRWANIKYLFREKLMHVIKDFHESSPSVDDIPQYPNVDPFNYETMKSALLERLELFNAAPFTVQRLCELLTDPRKQYARIDKYMRALEKNILVVSTVEPGRKQPDSENGDSLDSVVNGDLSLDVNVDIDMENEPLFMHSQNTSSTSSAKQPDEDQGSAAKKPKLDLDSTCETKSKSESESDDTSDDSDSLDGKEPIKEDAGPVKKEDEEIKDEKQITEEKEIKEKPDIIEDDKNIDDEQEKDIPQSTEAASLPEPPSEEPKSKAETTEVIKDDAADPVEPKPEELIPETEISSEEDPPVCSVSSTKPEPEQIKEESSSPEASTEAQTIEQPPPEEPSELPEEEAEEKLSTTTSIPESGAFTLSEPTSTTTDSTPKIPEQMSVEEPASAAVAAVPPPLVVAATVVESVVPPVVAAPTSLVAVVPDQPMDENLDSGISSTCSAAEHVDEVVMQSETEMATDQIKIGDEKTDLTGMDIDDTSQEEAMDQ